MKTNDIQFDAYGRMLYHPDYHPNHKAPWTTADQRFLIENYAGIGPEETSLALGRTIHSVMQRATDLRRDGVMPKPKGMPHTKRQIRKPIC